VTSRAETTLLVTTQRTDIPIKMSANRHLEIDGVAGHDDTPEVTSHDGWSVREFKNNVIYFITSHYVHAVCVCLMKYEK
jgi:hypothetical protein